MQRLNKEKNSMSFIKILSLSTLCLALLIAFYGPHKFLEQLWGNPDMGYVDIKSLRPAKRPNTALACPVDYCNKQRTVDITTDIYTVTSDVLREEIIKYFRIDKNAKMIIDPENKLSLRFVTHSPILRFPDTIQVQLIPIDKTTSTLAILASAKMGHTDFGANKARIEKILSAITPFAKP